MADHDDVLTYQRLTDEQRGIAWAVVRSIATALWVAAVPMVLVWAVIAAKYQQRVSLWWLIPLVGTVGMAWSMELKSRDLEKPVR